MPSDPTSAQHFGGVLRTARKAAGYSSTERLAAEMTSRGYSITGANISAWERGDHSPRTREPVELLEQILGITDGHLTRAIGLQTGPDLAEVTAQMTVQVSELTAQVRDLHQIVRAHLRDHEAGEP